jgi:chromosome segregation ATPase
MEVDKPSKDPIYWAKKNCKDCLGRGVMGKITQNVGNGNKIINEQLCSCVKKAFSVWQEQWVESHKDKVAESSSEIVVSALDTEIAQKSPIEDRIERIDVLCQPLKDEIENLKNKRDDIPITVGMVVLEESVRVAQQASEQAKGDIAKVLLEADTLDSKAAELYAQVKVLRHQADQLRTTERSKKQTILDQKENELRSCEDNLEQGKDRCARELKKVHKRIRELEDKLDRLEERRYKILKEHGIITKESTVTA